MAYKFIDNLGLAHLIGKIKTLLNGKADTDHTHLYAGSSTAGGVATSASKLANARTISLSGDATGSNTFDGSANKDIAVTLANSGVTAGSYGLSANATPAYGATFNVPYITVDAKGRVTSASTKTVKIPASDKVTVDTAMSSTSTNPVQNKVVNTALSAKANTSDLAKVATSGKYSDLSGTPTSLPANGGNASTVGGFTVGTNVPANAVFTDTKYTLSSFGITATANELNVLDGITATTTELNHCDGVTSNIQAQLNALAQRIATLEANSVGKLATVATTGSYKDLIDLPTKLNEIKDY